tara:strand:+ start:1012 stop:2088 length:1077 start_codon:yes stop_codon:yes gene_type:complete
MNKLILLFVISSIFLIGVLIAINTDFLDNFLLNNIFNDNSSIKNFDANLLISIHSEADIIQKRNDLKNSIWYSNEIPKTEKIFVEKNISDTRFLNIKNLKQIDKIIIEMEHDVNSIVYLFHAQENNGELIIYHQGHSGGFVNGKSTIDFLLTNGYSVMAFSMPLKGLNSQPIVQIPNIGDIKLIEHDQFELLETNDFSPLHYFFSPINDSLNYLDKNYSFSKYHMIGISGGGWTTTVYPAIDTRIIKSFAVSGSLPLPLRIVPEDIGDYEQSHPKIYGIANYLELYVMSSYGHNREFVQVFNKFDPCCFSGTLFENYQDEIKNKLSKLNYGKFAIILDDTHNEHKISEYALEQILKKI